MSEDSRNAAPGPPTPQREQRELMTSTETEVGEPGTAPLHEVLGQTPERSSAWGPGEVVLGWLRAVEADGGARVDFVGNPAQQPAPARATVALQPEQVGRQVALLFEGGDPRRPLILGVVHEPVERSPMTEPEQPGTTQEQPAVVTPNEDPAQGAQHLRPDFELSGATELQELSAKSVEQSSAHDDEARRLVISADQEIVLRCGEASITLTRAGKIVLRGKYILSRSSGVQRIRGGSVQIN